MTLAPALMLAALPHRGWIDFYQIVTGADALWAGHNPYFWQYHNPPWFAVMLGPLLPLPYGLQAEVWFWLNLTALLTALWLWLPAAGIPRRSLAAAALVSATVVFAPTVHNLIHGQSTLLAVLALAVLATAPGRNPAVAGAALTLLTVKPQVSGLLLLAIGLRLLARREWRPLAWAAGLLFGLTGIALILRPTALHEWVWSLTNGSLVTTGSPALYHLLQELGLGVAGVAVAVVVSAAAVALLLRLAWHGRDRGVGPELVSVGILASLLAAPYSHSYDYVVLLLPALMALGRTSSSGRGSSFVVLAAVLVAWLLPLGPFVNVLPKQAALGSLLIVTVALWWTLPSATAPGPTHDVRV